MVQISSSLIVAAALVASGFASPIAPRSASQVAADIASISSKVASLKAAINGFTGGLSGALAIHNDAEDVDTAVSMATGDISTTGRFSPGDSDNMVGALQKLQPEIIATLEAIVEKKPEFESLTVGGIPKLIENDLINLDAGTTKFENVFISAVSANKMAEAKAVKAALDPAFQRAKAAYA